jgi:hypothetical protein
MGQQLSFHTGNVQYDESDRAAVDPLAKMTNDRNSRVIVTAGEALTRGQLVTLSVVDGKITAYKANATNLSRPAHAVCDPDSIDSGKTGEVIFMHGRTDAVAGTTFGAAYYLAADGQMQITPPVATGVINQIVGIGLGSLGFYLNIEPIGRRPVYVYKFSASLLRVLYSDGTFADNPV